MRTEIGMLSRGIRHVPRFPPWLEADPSENEAVFEIGIKCGMFSINQQFAKMSAK